MTKVFDVATDFVDKNNISLRRVNRAYSIKEVDDLVEGLQGTEVETLAEEAASILYAANFEGDKETELFISEALATLAEDEGPSDDLSDSEDGDESDLLSGQPDELPEDTSDEEQEEEDSDNPAETDFAQEFPDVDSESLLETLYKDWLNSIHNKSFYRIIKSYRAAYEDGTLNVLDKVFMYRLIKAVSSAITHLAIEAEVKLVAVLLFETYYDELVACMNNVVHATTKDDIMTSYEYMLQFLDLDTRPEEDLPESDSEM